MIMFRKMNGEKFHVKIFQGIFLLSGVLINSRDERSNFEKYYGYACVAIYPFLLVPQFAPILTLNNFYHKIITLVFFLSSANIVAMTVWIHRKRHKLVALYEEVILKNAMLDDECTRYFNSTLKRKLKVILLSLLSIMFLVYSTPMFVKFSSSAFSDEVDPIYMLFIPAEYLWAMDSVVSYSSTILFQLVTNFIAALTALGHVLCLQYFHALFETMKLSMTRKIQGLDRRADFHDTEWDRGCVGVLCDVIRSYNLLLKMMKIFEDLMKPYIFLATWTFFAAGAVVTGIQILAVGKQTFVGYLVTILRTLSFQILFGANLIFCTQVSQWCYEVNDGIQTTLYQTNWYNKSIRFRETMVTFMCLLQRSYCIKAFGISTLNWPYITKLTKFTYSALRVLSDYQ